MTNLERWRVSFPIVELERPAGFTTHERVKDALDPHGLMNPGKVL